MRQDLLARLPQNIGLFALGICLTGHLLSSPAQAQSTTAAPRNAATNAATTDIAMDDAAAPAASAVNDMSPRQRALIEELLTLTNQEALFDQTMAATMQQVSQNMPALMEGVLGEPADPNALAEGKAMMERVMGKILTGFQSRISFQDIAEDVYYPLYAKNFSEAQLQDMIDFYNTPTGQHTIAVMPQLVQDSMALTQQRIMPTMIEVLREVMAEEMGGA